jgi:hypothetical protein
MTVRGKRVTGGGRRRVLRHRREGRMDVRAARSLSSGILRFRRAFLMHRRTARRYERMIRMNERAIRMHERMVRMDERMIRMHERTILRRRRTKLRHRRTRRMDERIVRMDERMALSYERTILLPRKTRKTIRRGAGSSVLAQKGSFSGEFSSEKHFNTENRNRGSQENLVKGVAPRQKQP